MQNLKFRLTKMEGIIPAAKPQRVIRVVGTDEAEMEAFLAQKGYGEDKGDLIIMHRIVAPARSPASHVAPYLL